MILDYSEILSQNGAFGLNSGNRNRDLYFEKRGYCPNCRNEIGKIHNNGFIDTKTIPNAAWHRHESVWFCNDCGWWEHSYHSQLESEDYSQEYKDWEVEVNSAILRKFDISSNQVPLATLESYLSKKSEEIINIHHKKMEELVASIFSEHYKCTAKVVGRSSDGGIDIILITSDKPIVVQVKRRKSLLKTESVAPVRELIGATLLKDAKDCIFVTTGERFTRSAVKAKEDALTKNIVNTFELYNRDEFIEVLKLNGKKNDIAYLKYLKI